MKKSVEDYRASIATLIESLKKLKKDNDALALKCEELNDEVNNLQKVLDAKTEPLIKDAYQSKLDKYRTKIIINGIPEEFTDDELRYLYKKYKELADIFHFMFK